MPRLIRRFLAFWLGFIAVAAEVTCYWLEVASDRLYAASCRFTED